MADENSLLGFISQHSPTFIAAALFIFAEIAMYPLVWRERPSWMFAAWTILSLIAAVTILGRTNFPKVNLGIVIATGLLIVISAIGLYAIWQNGGLPPESAYMPRPNLRTPQMEGSLVQIDMGSFNESFFSKQDFDWVPGRLGPLGKNVGPIDHRFCPIRIYFEKGNIFVDATIYGGTPGASPIIVKHNKVDPDSTVMNTDVDWNSDPSALEIVDGHQSPLFQLVFDPPSKIIVRGIFWTPSDEAITIDDTFTPYYIDLSADGAKVPAMLSRQGRLFQYPSDLHAGERDKSPKPPPGPPVIRD